jgi:predicted RNase H-like nuclease
VTAFLGLDLAWTAHRESGVCVLRERGGEVTIERLDAAVVGTEELAALVCSLGDDVVAAIDAPLMLTDERRAERELGRVYGARKAGAYLATRPFLEKMSGLAGPNLAVALALAGGNFDPARFWASRRGRHVFEVYPHAAHVSLFALDERIPYKKGTIVRRRSGLQLLQGHLGALLARDLPVVARHPLARAAIDPALPSVLRGRALKHLEDQLDGLTCAYTAYHLWRHGEAGTEQYGGWEDGSIVVPRWPAGHALAVRGADPGGPGDESR